MSISPPAARIITSERYSSSVEPHRSDTIQGRIPRRISGISAPEIGTVNPPKVELITAAMRMLNVRPEECVMVGDRFFDIDGGREAGVRTIGAAYGYGGRAEMEAHGATWIAETTTEIAGLVETL